MESRFQILFGLLRGLAYVVREGLFILRLTVVAIIAFLLVFLIEGLADLLEFLRLAKLSAIFHSLKEHVGNFFIRLSD